MTEIETPIYSLETTPKTKPTSAASIVSEAAMKLKPLPEAPPATPPPVAVTPHVVVQSVPTASTAPVEAESEVEAEFPYISVLAGWGCLIAGTFGILYAAFVGDMGVLAVAAILVFTGFGIMFYHGDKMFGTSENAKTFKAIFTGIIWFLWAIFLLLKLFGNNTQNKKNTKNNGNRKNRR